MTGSKSLVTQPTAQCIPNNTCVVIDVVNESSASVASMIDMADLDLRTKDFWNLLHKVLCRNNTSPLYHQSSSDDLCIYINDQYLIQLVYNQ